MSEQDLERIANIMNRLNNADDRALVTRLAMRDLVASLVQQSRSRSWPLYASAAMRDLAASLVQQDGAGQAQQKPTAG